MSNKIITIKAIDKKIKISFVKTFLFCVNYSKKIRKNEVHIPTAAKINIETTKEIIQFIFTFPIIESDKEGNIEIHVFNTWRFISGSKPSFTSKILKLAKIKNNFYANKSKMYLSTKEIIDYQKYKSLLDLYKILNQRISYEKGGDF